MTILDPPQGTLIPAAFDALMAGFNVATDPAVQVLDGLPTQWPKSECVVVGVSVPGQPGIQQRLDFDARTLGYRESFDVTCAIWSWGDSESTMKTVRDRCADMLDALRLWVGEHRDLDGIAFDVRLGQNLAWVPRNRGDGAECTVGFTVQVSVGI